MRDADVSPAAGEDIYVEVDLDEQMAAEDEQVGAWPAAWPARRSGLAFLFRFHLDCGRKAASAARAANELALDRTPWLVKQPAHATHTRVSIHMHTHTHTRAHAHARAHTPTDTQTHPTRT